tara:strand:- start:196 stop:453 length:258 start_codon:yes stop_codon:yes gene_type:complete
MDKEELQLQLKDNECLLADGFDSALIGITDGINSVAVYDSNLCIELLIKEGMSDIDAIEHFYYNVAGSYVGDKTPVFIKQLTTNI